MAASQQTKPRDSARIVIEPPTFSPPQEMRAAYLARRKGEIESMLICAECGEWKSVMTIANHVRGSGAMYGFGNIGQAAESLVRAVQNGDAKSGDFMRAYAQTVNESYV